MNSLASDYLDLAVSDKPTESDVAQIGPFGMPSSRVVATMFADGKSPRDIAAALQLQEEKVRAILRLPETQQVLAELVVSQGEGVVSNILKASRLDTVLRLIQLRDAGSSDTVRLAACKELLDRAEGRAKTKDKDLDEGSNLPGDLQQRMKYLQEEINRMKGDTP